MKPVTLVEQFVSMEEALGVNFIFFRIFGIEESHDQGQHSTPISRWEKTTPKN